MMGQLVARGHELTPHPDQADVLVVNTCSFIDPAKKESVDTILEMAEYKKVGRARKLIVAGCLVERYRGDIRRNFRKWTRWSAPTSSTASSPFAKAWSRPPTGREPYLYHDLTPRVLATPRHFAYIKIAEGCDHPCTFCVIPQYRGQVPQPPLRIGDLRSHAPVRAGRPRDQPDRAGHHLLRRRPRPQGRPGAPAGTAGRHRNAARKMGSLPLRLSQQGHPASCSTPSPRTRRWSSTSTCRCSTPAPAC